MRLPPLIGTVGLIGLGKVGALFAGQLAQAGYDVIVYDRNLDRPGGLALLRQRVPSLAVRIAARDEVVRSSQVILSLVPGTQALEVGYTVQPFLGRQLYGDLTTASPDRKRELGAIVSASGASFVDAVILDGIGAMGAEARILACGEASGWLCMILGSAGLKAEPFGDEIGRAATLKLLRSVWSKGLEALMLEAFAAARNAALERELWTELERFGRADLIANIQGWVQSHPQARERRAAEMIDVLQLLESLRVSPTASRGVAEFFACSVETPTWVSPLPSIEPARA